MFTSNATKEDQRRDFDALRRDFDASAIHFPDDLRFPIGSQMAGFELKKGVKSDQPVFWGVFVANNLNCRLQTWLEDIHRLDCECRVM